MKKIVYIRKESIKQVIGIPEYEIEKVVWKGFSRKKIKEIVPPKIYVFHVEDINKPYWFSPENMEEFDSLLKKIIDSLENKEGDSFVKITTE